MPATQISLNVRFLLWRRDIPRGQWKAWLEARVAWPRARISALLRGSLEDAGISRDEEAELTGLFDLSAADGELRFRDLPGEHGRTLQENLSYLLGSLERGGKKAMADAIGVDQTTISRWLNGTFEPNRTSLAQLAGHFGLSARIDLARDPVYLSPDPVSRFEQIQWLRERVEALDPDELRDLYPALRRLLEEQ